MNTYAIQLELHFQSERADDDRFDRFVEDVKTLAEQHGIEFGEVQSMCLRGSEYRIAPCSTCSHLTVNRADIGPSQEAMLPDFWFYVRRGMLTAGRLTCDHCG